MKKIKVLKRNNLPTHLPLSQTLLFLLALDHWKAAQWVWGAVGLFMLIVWIICIVAIVNEQEVDVLKND